MPDYKKGVIYCIRSNENEDIYIGSTCVGLSQRMAHHRGMYKQFLNGNGGNITSFQILKNQSAYIELIEEYPCDNRQQLEKREGEIMRSRNCVNRNIAGRTDVEYRQENREKIAEKCRRYREANKEKISEYREANNEKLSEKRNEKQNCECGGKFTRTNRKRHILSQTHQKFIAENLKTL